eukprot:scaffold374_cov418-Pavlova_lutheri.AAC.3
MMSRDEGATHAGQVTPSPLPNMVYFPVAPTNSAASPAASSAASPAANLAPATEAPANPAPANPAPANPAPANPAPANPAPANPAMVEGEAPTAISHPYNLCSRGNKALEAAATRQWEISNDFSGYARAMARPDADLWKEAITDELTSLAKNGTWRLVPLPPGRTPLTTTWVFKVKTDGDGEVERYKARLCVRGFEQRARVDFHEVFAPTSGKVAQRAFLTYAALVNYEVQQVDIKTAFLNAKLNEDIYVQIPEELKGSMKTTGEEEQEVKLEKSLYGLKQAPRMWHHHLTQTLKSELGFVCNPVDENILKCIHQDTGKECLILIYVDDLLIAAEDLNTT